MWQTLFLFTGSDKMVVVKRSNVEGFEVVELVGNGVCVGVIPDLGAKIVSLKHLQSGREWMWKSERNPQYFRVLVGTPFDQGPLVGADECMPTLAACRWRSRDLPDHGEAWSQPWALDEARLADGRITTQLNMPISLLHIERTLSLDGDQVRFDYRLRNLSDEPQEYLWSLHPMMNIEPDDRILLPETCRQVRTESCFGDCPLGTCGDTWDWPQPTADIDFSRLNLGGAGRAVKLYTEPLTEGQAAIVNETTGERLSFLFDPSEVNTLGIWINRGGFGGFDHVALEPANAAPDSLAVAVQDWKRYGHLAPKETKRWTLILQLSIT